MIFLLSMEGIRCGFYSKWISPVGRNDRFICFARLIHIQSFRQNGEIYYFYFFLLFFVFVFFFCLEPSEICYAFHRSGKKERKIKNKRCFHARNCEYLVLLIVYTEPLLYRKFYLSLFTVPANAAPPFVRAYAHVTSFSFCI